MGSVQAGRAVSRTGKTRAKTPGVKEVRRKEGSEAQVCRISGAGRVEMRFERLSAPRRRAGTLSLSSEAQEDAPSRWG